MINDNITITSLHKGNITPDALVDEIRRLMAERNKAIVELDAARAELAEAQGNFEHLKEHFHALFADGGIRLESMAADRDAARAELAAQSKLLDDAREQAGAFRAERDALRAQLEIATEALKEFEQWADGYTNRVTGMGAGLHAEKWPMLGPGAYLEMLRLARTALERIKP